jgi:hypothetical protein
MADRGMTAGLAIWVRVPGTIALVLAGVFVSAILLGVAGVGGGKGPDKHAPVQRHNPGQQLSPGHSGGGHQPPAGGH